MDGKYGDSTRSVKAVGSEAIPGTPVAPPPVPASTYHLSPDETEPLDSYGRSSNPTWRQLESALAELEGAATALTFGSGMAAITSALRVFAKPGTKLVVPADGYYQVRRYAMEYLAPQGVTVVEARQRRYVRSVGRCRRGACGNPVQSGTRRRRPAPSGDGLPWPRRHSDRRQHHRDTPWPAAAVAGRRPGGGQRDQGAVGAQRSPRRLRRGQPTRTDGRRSSATGCWPGRSSARSRRGWCCAASAARACGSNGSARTHRRSR